MADEYALYTKTRNAHWNVNGPNFHSLHKFFESQYKSLDQTIDDIAERVRSLFRKFQITETINDKVQIANTEGSMKFMFYFENNRLRRINSYLYLD